MLSPRYDVRSTSRPSLGWESAPILGSTAPRRKPVAFYCLIAFAVGIIVGLTI